MIIFAKNWAQLFIIFCDYYGNFLFKMTQNTGLVYILRELSGEEKKKKIIICLSNKQILKKCYRQEQENLYINKFDKKGFL